MESQKTILWVEDFANDSDLVPDEYDPTQEIIPDRTKQIQEVFPLYLVDKVQVLEDPTKLPEYMKRYGKNYEFIILDINFESGISQISEDVKALEQEIYLAQVPMPPLSQIGTVKDLGCYLRSYLIAKWQFLPNNIVFFSAYGDQNTVNAFQNRPGWEIKPHVFDKKDSKRMWKYLNKRFSPNRITDESAIVRAKNLYRFWAANGIPSDSILRKAKSETISESDIIRRIGRVLDETNSGSGQDAYDKILHEATFAFEGEINYKVEGRWYKKVYEVLKCLRNTYAHRSTMNSGLSAIEFLLMFAVALRAIFESTSQPVYDLHEEEKWLVNGLERIADQNGVVSRLSDDQINVCIEETMLQWYLGLESGAHFVGDGYSMLCSRAFKKQYTLENVVQLFCMRAMNTMIHFDPSIPCNGSPKAISPSILCSFRANRKGSDQAPEAMKKLAKAYICSQLTSETKELPPFPLYI